jgi:hypothetical protein
MNTEQILENITVEENNGKLVGRWDGGKKGKWRLDSDGFPKSIHLEKFSTFFAERILIQVYDDLTPYYEGLHRW